MIYTALAQSKNLWLRVSFQNLKVIKTLQSQLVLPVLTFEKDLWSELIQILFCEILLEPN